MLFLHISLDINLTLSYQDWTHKYFKFKLRYLFSFRLQKYQQFYFLECFLNISLVLTFQNSHAIEAKTIFIHQDSLQKFLKLFPVVTFNYNNKNIRAQDKARFKLLIDFYRSRKVHDFYCYLIEFWWNIKNCDYSNFTLHQITQ